MAQPAASVTRFLRFGAVVAAMALAACANQPRSGSAAGGGTSGVVTPQAAAPQFDPNGPVTVALLAPTTADSRGARAAAQDIVAAAQIARSELAPANMALKIYDTRGTPAGAAEAAARAAAEGAALILGPLRGSAATAAGPAAAGLNVLAFSNDATAAGGNVWILGQSPEDEMRRLFGYAGSQGVGSIAVAYPTNRYGELVASAAPAVGRSAGVGAGPFVGYERSFQGIEAASRDAAAAIRSQGAQGVLIADAGDALRSMGAFLAYYDVSPSRVKYMGLSRWADPANGREAALVGGWFATADPAMSAAFDQKFQNRVGRRASPVASVGYDAVAAAATMLRDAQQGRGAAFGADAITRPAGFRGATGPFVLTRDGLNRRSLAIMQVGQGGPSVVDPAPTRAPTS